MKPLPCVTTGVANLASVAAAFARLGRRLVPIATDELATAPALVLPGVGQFGAAMQTLAAAGAIAPLRARLLAGKPTLGICLGMQLCCRASDEAPAQPGLAALDAVVTRFPGDVCSPQMGWNEVEAPTDAALLRSGHAYFANSYRLVAAPPGYRAATSEHGGPFVAAVERGPVLLCQFHPELSGSYGSELLARWLDAAEATC